MQRVFFFGTALVLACGAAQVGSGREPGSAPIDVGSRLELFVDEHLVDKLEGEAGLHLHKPQPQEVVLVADKPWEQSTAYCTVFQDGELYRMYFRGHGSHPREVTCYAESKDGRHWTRPALGLFEFEGSKTNNIVWDGVGTHNFTPFKDANPNCAADAKYKALGRGSGTYRRGLYAFQSPDGIHWKLVREEPVITLGAFDSQNLAFWDPVRRQYRAYWRIFTAGIITENEWKPQGLRSIRTATSEDFLDWGPVADLQYPDSPGEHLYTNAILPYPRAPHLLLGFPTRFLPETQQTEPTLMSSRDGLRWRRWIEALIPLDAPENRDGNRGNYMAWGMVQLPGNHHEYSMYATEGYAPRDKREPLQRRLRRFTYRVDGFVSVRAGAQGGQLLTQPITFAGRTLVVNFAASGAGSMRVEIQDADGKALDGFALADCRELCGDAIEQPVVWRGGADVRALAGKPVRLRFALNSADLFSYRFLE